jgi:hypothetical protein
VGPNRRVREGQFDDHHREVPWVVVLDGVAETWL